MNQAVVSVQWADHSRGVETVRWHCESLYLKGEAGPLQAVNADCFLLTEPESHVFRLDMVVAVPDGLDQPVVSHDWLESAIAADLYLKFGYPVGMLTFLACRFADEPAVEPSQAPEASDVPAPELKLEEPPEK